MSDDENKLEPYIALLSDILNLFESLGVREGEGADGKLMARTRALLEGVEVKTTSLKGFRISDSMCPLCMNPDYTACDCPPDEQWAALEKIRNG